MASGTALSFDDLDLYQEAVRVGRSEVFVTAAGKFSGELARIDMERLWLQYGADNLARVARVAITPERAPIFFLAALDQAPIQHSGRQLRSDQIAFYGAATIDIQTTRGAHRWSAMSLPPGDLARRSEAITGRPIASPSDTYILRPDPVRFARLRKLHDDAVRLAAREPLVLAHPETAKALEEDLIVEMVACLEPPTTETRRFWQHAKVMKRFDALLAHRRYEPVYLAEVCAVVGVSERTLRTCCHEMFGMGPARYLWLRRMHFAKRVLLRAMSAETTVTRVATEYGFWELGRFAVAYGALFGETPSQTLRRAPTRAALAH